MISLLQTNNSNRRCDGFISRSWTKCYWCCAIKVSHHIYFVNRYFRRAVYFATYNYTKQLGNTIFVPDTPVVHMLSAGLAGLVLFVLCNSIVFILGMVSASFANPIWLIKTRLQLDRHRGAERLTITKCIKNVWQKEGLKGYYRVCLFVLPVFNVFVHYRA
jgi:hypothetical protein